MIASSHEADAIADAAEEYSVLSSAIVMPALCHEHDTRQASRYTPDKLASVALLLGRPDAFLNRLEFVLAVLALVIADWPLRAHNLQPVATAVRAEENLIAGLQWGWLLMLHGRRLLVLDVGRRDNREAKHAMTRIALTAAVTGP